MSKMRIYPPPNGAASQAARLEQLHQAAAAVATAAVNTFVSLLSAYEAGAGPGVGAPAAMAAAQSIAATVAQNLKTRDPIRWAATTRGEDPVSRFWAAASAFVAELAEPKEGGAG